MEIKYFIPIYGSYYHFITESLLGLYSLLKENSKLGSLDCRLWYQGNYGEIVQMFSCYPIVKIPITKPYLKNAKKFGWDIRTLRHVHLHTKDDFTKLIPMAKFLNDRTPIHEEAKGITIIKRVHRREHEETQELAEKLRKFQLPVRVVQFENLSFPEQVNVARHTILLIAPHGAGTMNQIFMPKGSKIIELFPRGDFNWHAQAVAEAFGHEWMEIESDKPGIFGRQPSERIRKFIEEKGWPSRAMVQRQPSERIRKFIRFMEEKDRPSRAAVSRQRKQWVERSSRLVVTMIKVFLKIILYERWVRRTGTYELKRVIREVKSFSIDPDKVMRLL